MTTPPPELPTQKKDMVQKSVPTAIDMSRIATPHKAVMNRQGEQATAQSTTQLTNQPSEQPTSRPVDQPVNRSVDQQLMGKVVDRPVAFYLPESINEKIDEAVDYLEKQHRTKVDRSAVVSAILGNPTIWEPEALNQLVDKAVSQLTSRLTSRLTR